MRGIPQLCPLPALLFVISIEILKVKLKENREITIKIEEEKKNSKKYHSWQMIQYYCKKINCFIRYTGILFFFYNDVVQLKKGRKAV